MAQQTAADDDRIDRYEAMADAMGIKNASRRNPTYFRDRRSGETHAVVGWEGQYISIADYWALNSRSRTLDIEHQWSDYSSGTIERVALEFVPVE
jgi:nitric oxide synthase oxygenase domain/subunit